MLIEYQNKQEGVIAFVIFLFNKFVDTNIYTIYFYSVQYICFKLTYNKIQHQFKRILLGWLFYFRHTHQLSIQHLFPLRHNVPYSKCLASATGTVPGRRVTE